jgi:hypothetical protein
MRVPQSKTKTNPLVVGHFHSFSFYAHSNVCTQSSRGCCNTQSLFIYNPPFELHVRDVPRFGQLSAASFTMIRPAYVEPCVCLLVFSHHALCDALSFVST